MDYSSLTPNPNKPDPEPPNLLPDGKEESIEFILPMSKKDLASYFGTTPETVSRKLTDLEDARYIKQMPHRKIKF